jgi:hypothetical protein
MYRWLINTRAWDFFPKERFDQINDLHTHAAWDFVNKNSVRGAGIGGRTRHRCQICSAVGAIWHGEYRGGTLEPRRALVMCSGPRCPRAYCRPRVLQSLAPQPRNAGHRRRRRRREQEVGRGT